jgi:hypothetical protein
MYAQPQQQHPSYYQGYPYMAVCPPNQMMNGPGSGPPAPPPQPPMPIRPKKPKKDSTDVNKVVDEIIGEMKIKGLFDKFRKDCLTDVEEMVRN